MTINIFLTPGKLYKIKTEHKERIMNLCDGRDYIFMYKNIICPMLLLSDSKKVTVGIHEPTPKTLLTANTITTIFLVENKTVEFRSELLVFRTTLLNALLELK